jgi:hypothetical protein
MDLEFVQHSINWGGEGVVPGVRPLRLWRSGEVANPQNASEFNFLDFPSRITRVFKQL